MKQLLEFEKPVQKLRDELEALRTKAAAKPSDKLNSQIADLEAKLDKLQRETHANLNPWQRVQISRHLNRPFMLDYV
jgi:acetyl-CoA carboxylase carboxyl transferase subunit alpha